MGDFALYDSQPEPLHPDRWKYVDDYQPITMRTYLERCKEGQQIIWDDGDLEEKQYNTPSLIPESMAPFDAFQHLGGDGMKKGGACVERVRCLKCKSQDNKVIIARKLVDCRNDATRVQGRGEIKCLQGLQHPHIVALVGTYWDAYQIGILLYPAAEWNLEDFMDAYEHSSETTHIAKRYYLKRYFVCLCQALDFLHRTAGIRHKDIKPKNILVDSFGNVLLADFGLSRKYRTAAESETNTEKYTSYDYSAPEFHKRGAARTFKTDIYALGLIFAEMATVVLDTSLEDFKERRRASRESNNKDWSYHKNSQAVTIWLNELIDGPGDPATRSSIWTIKRMILKDPKLRPGTENLWEAFQDINPHQCMDCDPRQPETAWKVNKRPISEEAITEYGFGDHESITSVISEEELGDADISTSSQRDTPTHRFTAGTSSNGNTSNEHPSYSNGATQPTKIIFPPGQEPKNVIIYDWENDILTYGRFAQIKSTSVFQPYTMLRLMKE
jgi:serine/threonine protein kinase